MSSSTAATHASGKVVTRLLKMPATLSTTGNTAARAASRMPCGGTHQSDSGEPLSQNFGSRHAARNHMKTGRSPGGSTQ